MLEMEDVKNFKIVRPNLNVPNAAALAMGPEMIFNIAMTGMPEIKGSEFRVSGSEKALKVAQGGMSPRLSLSGAYGTGYSGASKDITSVTPTGNWDTSYYFTSGG